MTLLISQDSPADQNYNLFYFIFSEQLFKLTAIDMKTALISDLLESENSSITCVQFHIPLIFCIYEVSHPFGACSIQERYQTRSPTSKSGSVSSK